MRAAGAMLLVMAMACGDSAGVDPVARPPAVASVTVTPTSGSLEVGGTVTIVATPRDAAGRPLSGRTIAFTSSAEAVVTVSPAGVVTAVGAGTAMVTASTAGRSARAAFIVTEPGPPPPPPVASVTLDQVAVTVDEGGTVRLVATPRDAAGEAIEGLVVEWSTSNAEAATVAADGLVSGVRMGLATVTASVQGASATARVMVFGHDPYDLLLDIRTAETGGVVRPSIHRIDLRVPEAAPHPVTIEPGAREATASPDGARLAYTCDRPHGTAICVAERNGANVVVLTGTTMMLADQPAWSPDGSWIAFRRWAPGGPPGPFNPSRIWVMDADGNVMKQVTDGDGWQESPTWSPMQPGGGHRIAYSHKRLAGGYVTGTIRSVRADGSDVRQVTATVGQLDDEPSWSPDGTRILFVRTGGEAGGDLWLANAAGGGERPLMAADPAGAQRSPAWSPDGLFVAFASSHDIDPDGYGWQIYTVRADGTGLVRRTFSRTEKGNPAWMGR